MLGFLKEYEQYLVENTNFAANTYESYLRDVRQHLQFLQKEGVENIKTVSTTTILSYMFQLKKKGLSTSTILRKLSSLRGFYNFMLEEGYVEQNPTIDLKAPKVEKKPPCILTAQEIRTLLAQPTGKDSKALRDKAMLELLYATGIRVSELVALNIDDVDLERGSIKCDNNNKRIIPVNTQALYYLKQYLFYARGLMIRDDSEVALFVNFHGNRMTRQGFWKLIKHYTSEAKIDKDITPHTLRHSFAIHLLNDGADIHRLKEILGHSALSTTQVYAQFSNKDAEQNREKENPGI